MRLFPSILLAAAVPLAACAGATPGPEVEVVAQDVTLPAACAAFADDRVLLTSDPGVARQGETISLRAYVLQGPYAAKDVPLECLAGWIIAPTGAATLSLDHSRLTIAADAPAGELLTVEAQGPGGFAHLTTTLIGRDERVLTGRWRQVDVDCPTGSEPREPVRELEFNAMGGFAVTYLPFETYKDYWGKARFDDARGHLLLTVQGGNREPRNPLLEGEARLGANGRLTLNGFHLGAQDPLTPARPCRYVFARL